MKSIEVIERVLTDLVGKMRGVAERIENKFSFWGAWIALYVINYLFILLNFRGAYWDDWTIVGQDIETFSQMFEEAGGIPLYFVHVAMAYIKENVFAYHALTFFFYALIYFTVYRILSLYGIKKSISKLLLVAITLAPINFARTAVINFPYTICLLYFVMALLFFTKKEKIFYRLLALALLMSSFWTQSIMFYFLCVLGLVIFKEKYEASDPWWLIIFKHMDFVMAPFVFLFISKIFFVPSGEYQSYNSISLKGLALGIPLVAKSLIYFTREVFVGYKLMAWVFPAAIILWVTIRKRLTSLYDEISKINILILLLAFLYAYFAAVYPYLVVRKFPTSYDMHSRHQLLLGPAFGLLMLLLLRLVIVTRSRDFCAFFLLVGFLCFSSINVSKYSDQIRHWFKRDALTMYIANDENVNHANRIFIYDFAPSFLRRCCSFYELTGAYRKYTGRADKMVLSAKNYAVVKSWTPAKEIVPKKQYSIYEYQGRPLKETHKLIVQDGRSLTITRLTKGLFWNLFDQDRYRSFLRKYFLISEV